MQGVHELRAFEMTLPFGGIARIRFNGYDLNRSGPPEQYPCCLWRKFNKKHPLPQKTVYG